MTSSKAMSSSSKTRKSDLSRRSASPSSTKFLPILTTNIAPATTASIPTDFGGGDLNLASMTVDGLGHNVYDSNPSTESTLLGAQITLIDTPKVATLSVDGGNCMNGQPSSKTVDDVWREIVSGDNSSGSRNNKELKEEAPDEMMTLEDFLAKAGAVDEDEVKMSVPGTERLSGGVFNFDPIPPSPFHALDKVEESMIGYGNGVEMMAGSVSSGGGSSCAGGGRGKRGRQVLEPLDKAQQQRQRRMIKNRESAARSRERKQAYQVELESLAVRLEEENEKLMKEKAEKTKERYKQLMENVIPVVEKRRPPHFLRRVRSMHW